MRGALLLLLCCAAVGCGGCPKSAPVDAGAPVVDAGVRLRRRADLRSALLVVFPEYRHTAVLGGYASLQRTVTGASEGMLAELAKQNGFASLDGGQEYRQGVLALRRARDDVYEVALALDAELLGRVMYAPSPMSTETMGLWLPKGPGVATVREVFELELRYEAETLGRANFLCWQLVHMLRGNGQWTVGALPEGFETERNEDGGAGDVPEAFTVTLTSADEGESVTLERLAKRVRVRYHLVTDEAAR